MKKKKIEKIDGVSIEIPEDMLAVVLDLPLGIPDEKTERRIMREQRKMIRKVMRSKPEDYICIK